MERLFAGLVSFVSFVGDKMNGQNKVYLCIDLKSFYASVECVERGLDPMQARLVVADPERGEKTICLAVSPALKALGVPNRCRVFEIPPGLDYIMAPPRMQLYINYAAEIYGVYLRYIAKEDIHVYSVDEAFLDVTPYLHTYGVSPRQMAKKLMNDVLAQTGVRATCGMGSNLYLAKVALDILAKHAPDFIGCLDEESYRAQLWEHQPLTDFWRIGRGTAQRLARYGINTMRQVAQADEELLYKQFGIDAELLIDHAWGRESVTIADIKAYQPKTNCLASGQVLMRDYNFAEARLIVKEMVDVLCLDLVDKELVTSSISMYIGYSNSLHLPAVKGSASLPVAASSSAVLVPAAVGLFEQIVDQTKPVRRINIGFNNLLPEGSRQLTLFDNLDVVLQRDRQVQRTVLHLKQKYGRNTILKGMNFAPGATGRERNQQIGGHKSGGEV